MNDIKGFMYKDWLLMNRQMKLFFIYILAFIMLSFAWKESNMLTTFFSVMMFMMSINCFAYDEQVNFDKLAAASAAPITKMVLSRYLTALSVGLAGTFLITVLQIIRIVVKKQDVVFSKELLLMVAGSLVTAILLISVMFPVFYKFGVNKSRLIILLIFLVPAFLSVGLASVIPKGFLSNFSMPAMLVDLLPYLLILLVVVCITSSVCLSSHIVKNKEY